MKTSLTYLGVMLAIGMTTVTLGGCGNSEQSKAQPSAYQRQQEPRVQPAAGKPVEKASEKPAGRKEGQAGHERGEEQPLKLSAEEIRSAGIKSEALQPQEVAEQVVVTATIRADQDRVAHVAPRVPARIVGVDANLGDRVRAGQRLALLDSLEVGEAYSAYLQARTQLEVAKADFERAEELHAEQIIAQKDHLRARAEYEKAKAALRAAEDKLRMLGVTSAQSAGDNAVSTFPLTTPFAGTVIEKHAILGELALPDKSVFTVADLSRLWIEANLFEKDLGRVRVGADAIVTVAAYPNEAFKGKLTYIAAVMDKETRTVQARVEVANPDGRLKPEMFATAAVQTGAKGKALLLPEEAVVLMQGQPTAFVAEHGGFEARPVQMGEKLRGRVAIRAGIEAGEQVVISGAYTLKARILKSQLGEGD